MLSDAEQQKRIEAAHEAAVEMYEATQGVISVRAILDAADAAVPIVSKSDYDAERALCDQLATALDLSEGAIGGMVGRARRMKDEALAAHCKRRGDNDGA